MQHAESLSATDYSVRSFRPSDLPALTLLTAKAFAADKTWGERRTLTEITLPALLASGPSFDPELVLVAEGRDGGLLGAAIWYPYAMRLRGERIVAANLAPLAVDPEVKGRGLGSALMRASFPVLEGRGASLAFLCGHEAYYPRFGFLKNMFGQFGLRPARTGDGEQSPDAAGDILRAPRPSDEAVLLGLWETCQGSLDFALEPEPGFVSWMAWTPSTQALVLESDGKLAAYARFANERPSDAFGGNAEPKATSIRQFLAADAAAAARLLSALGRPLGSGAGETSPYLPVHPDSEAAKRLFPAGFEAVRATGGYAMALPLEGGPARAVRAAAEYCALVSEGKLEPGLLVLPPIFDLE